MIIQEKKITRISRTPKGPIKTFQFRKLISYHSDSKIVEYYYYFFYFILYSKQKKSMIDSICNSISTERRILKIYYIASKI